MSKKTEFESLYECYLSGQSIDAEIMFRAMAQAVYDLLKKKKKRKKKKLK